MRLLARRLLGLLIVAFAIGSGVNGYAAALSAFDSHDHSGHAHSHASSHAEDHGDQAHAANDHHGHGIADPLSSGDDPSSPGEDPSSSDRACDHMHVHCCSSFAVATVDCGLKLAAVTRPAVRGVEVSIPLGKGVSDLFRPPRPSV